MVRLKAAGKIRELVLREFQFHMVRLKVTIQSLRLTASSISIPYGAIKRYTQHLRKWAQNLISIPYGAIKRVGSPFPGYSPSQFQFHMVRLKVPFLAYHKIYDDISIPYGAIKRYSAEIIGFAQ